MNFQIKKKIQFLKKYINAGLLDNLMHKITKTKPTFKENISLIFFQLYYIIDFIE